jgi:hypothetical protein
MNNEQPPRLDRALRLAPLAAAVLMAMTALPAAAQLSVLGPQAPRADDATAGGPFYFGASQAFTRDSNVFRLADDPAERPTSGGLPRPIVDDTISTTSLFAGVAAPFGRQRVTADALLSHNKYKDQSQLDHTGARLGLGLDWETAGRLSGTVSLIGQQRLARFGIEGTTQNTSKNLERAQQLGATVQLGGPSVLALYGLFDHRAVDYSQGAFAPIEYERTTFGVGARYRVGGALTLGGELRAGKGEYPNFTFGGETGDDFDRREAALTARWEPTGSSRLDARLGYVDQDHDFEERSFDGVTGALTWRYDTGGKLRFETELRRDTGNELQALLIAGAVEAVGDNSTVANRLQVRAFYDATAKVRFEALARHTRRNIDETTTVGGAPLAGSGRDSTTVLQLGVRWEPTRTVALGCGIGRENRDGSFSGTTVGAPPTYDYKANVASCFGQFVLNP